MFRDIYTALRPHFDDRESTQFYTDVVLEWLTLAGPGDLEAAEEISVDDAIFLLIEGDEQGLHPTEGFQIAKTVLALAGIKDFDSTTVEVSDGRLFVGSPEMLDVVENVVPGQWAVVFTCDFCALICENVLFDEADGHYERAVHSAGGCHGVWTDPSTARERFEAFGSSVNMDGLTARPTFGSVKSAVHRRSDGRCDAIFLRETKGIS